MSKCLAIIPARGGSKRIPKKNIRPFHGKPILSYIIDCAEKSGVFDAIHVSTDDPDIATIASQSGHEPDFSRPADLADDYTPIFDVVHYVAKTYRENGQDYDQFCLLYPTAPLMDHADLKKAYRDFQTCPPNKALMSITEYPCPVEWAYRKDDQNSLTPVEPSGFLKRSQDLKPAYFDAAMFVFYSAAFVFSQDSTTLDQNFQGYVVPPIRVTDIDTEEDWRHAELLYALMQNS